MAVGLFRLVLAFAVLAGHTAVMDLDILPGDLAVRAFFIISGFYMSLILTGRYQGKPRSVFYANRVLRLYPAYLLVLFVQAVVLMVWDIHPFAVRDAICFTYSEGGLIPVVHLLTNVFVFGQEAMFWLGLDIQGGTLFWDVPGGSKPSAFTIAMLPQAWALSVEFYFYLLAPFLVRLRGAALFVLFMASLLLRLFILDARPDYEDFAQRLFPAQLYLFIAGVLSFRIYERIKGARALRVWGAAMLGAVIAYVFGYGAVAEAWRDHVFLALVFLAAPAVFGLTARSGLDGFLGRLSYPFYLLHFLVIAVYEQVTDEYSPTVLILLVVSCSVAVLFAVEQPVDRIRRRLLASWPQRNKPAAVPA